MSVSNGSVNGLLVEGTKIAPGYEVLAHLSRSRSLDVYDTWSVERDCRCIAKVVRPDRGTPRAGRRLTREGELLLGLTHPHIVRAYDLRTRPRAVLVLETLGGETVDRMIERSARRLAVADIAHLGVQLCSAIGYLHGRGCLHLDLKPANVIVQSGQAKVIDLSLSQRPGRVPRGRGTPPYLSPEQARGGRGSAATDIWGIGATMFEAATGARPFPDARPGSYPQLERRAPSVAERRRVPAAFAAIVDACLAPDQSERPSVSQLAEELDAVIGD
jgi:eukaryotic-like serine/threonine-protein kinase